MPRELTMGSSNAKGEDVGEEDGAYDTRFIYYDENGNLRYGDVKFSLL